MGKLTARTVETKKTPGYYGDGDQLWLQVQSAGSKSWLFRYTLGVTDSGKPRLREMGLGRVADVTLAEARDAARDARRLLAQGIDPIEHRKQAKAARLAAGTTFRTAAEAYIAAHTDSWANAKHRQQWTNTLTTYAFPVFGDRNLASITLDDVRKVIEPIWNEKPETASRLRGRIETILDFATVRGWRTGDNPARWRGHLQKLLPARSKVAAVEHHPALPWRDLPGFMATLRGHDLTAARALQFTILTAARTSEAIGARWSEIDLAHSVWTVPASRMKAKRKHNVALSRAAVALLEAIKADAPRGQDLIFPGARGGTKPLSNMAMAKLLERMGRGDLTVHGFRSTFRDWAAEATAFPREVAEAALAHTLRDKVEAAYQRGDLFAKRAEMMEAWAGFCAGTTTAREAA